MTGIEKSLAVQELHKACTKDQAIQWIKYWAAILHEDHGLAALNTLKKDIEELYRRFYYAEELRDSRYDMMENFEGVEGEPEDCIPAEEDG